MFGPGEPWSLFRGAEELEDRELLRLSPIVLYCVSRKRHVNTQESWISAQVIGRATFMVVQQPQKKIDCGMLGEKTSQELSGPDVRRNDMIKASLSSPDSYFQSGWSLGKRAWMRGTLFGDQAAIECP
jgi:hypothetical protein